MNERIEITRKGLIITCTEQLQYAQGSANVPITITNDGTYSDYITELHFGYFNNGQFVTGICDYNTSYLLPNVCFKNKGPVMVCVHLRKGNDVFATNQIKWIVQPAPNGNEIIPTDKTWQQLVIEKIDEYMADLGYEGLAIIVDNELNTSSSNAVANKAAAQSIENIEKTMLYVDSEGYICLKEE